MLSGTTKVCMSLGYPITQSLSPAVQTAAFEEAKLDWIYVPWGVKADALPETVRALKASESYAGGNATAPHKQALMALLDDITPEAQAVGAVNVIFRRGADLVGDTSDGAGYVSALREGGIEPKGLRVVMLGAGGAARAVGLALQQAGVGRIEVLARKPQQAEEVAILLADAGAKCEAGVIAEIKRSLSQADLLINATSIGLQPQAKPLFDYSALPPSMIASDLVFLPSETPFLRAARERGCRTMNGLGMLLHQARISFERWTGHAAPTATMRRVLSEALAARERATANQV